ncbi:MAG: hypothetical protein KGZ25_11445, partial [Planctomycetes bacterium]|nr:hypothetical protein [Planctomycetota bacterium]
REQDLHQQFKRILNDQKDLHETCRILQANIRKGQKSGGDESDSMARLERGQRKMARRNIDIAGQFRGLVAQIRNNHLEKTEGPLQTRLTKEIIIPTTSLAQKWAPQAAHQFHQARENAGDAESCLKMLQKSERTQREIIARMLQIQKSMAKYETVHEAINILKKILHKQKELKKETEKERKEREKSVFE